MAIKIEDLYFSYGEKEILKGVNLNIQKGKLTGILGPNGCGKSTLLKNILGYLNHASGKIIINDIEKEKISRKNLAKILASVPQKSNLSAELTVIDFVMMGRVPHLKSAWRGYSKIDKNIAEEKLNSLNLINFKNRIALSLSGGEFQCVLLARALTQEPKILLLDEPTSALDINHAIALLKQIRKIIAEKNLTAVIVMHDLNLASLFCDELIVMKDGKTVTQGSPEKVITKELIKDVYNLEVHIARDENNKKYIIPKIKE